MRTSLAILAMLLILSPSTSAQTELYKISGSAPGQAVGSMVDEIGDYDSDGHADVLISDSGAVTIRSGSTGGLLVAIPANNALTAGAGDVDADGTPDLLIGITVYSGITSAPAGILTPTNPNTLWNAFTDSDGAGDLNQDGFDDVVIGSAFESSPIPLGGAVRAFSGKTFSQLYYSGADFTEDQYGWQVSGTGDLDGDGFADFAGSTDLVGGYSRVFSGKDGSLLYSHGSSFSVSNAPVSQVGDVNGDNHPDYAVGSSGGFSVAVYSGKDGSLLNGITLEGASFSFFSAHAGDVNGDGFADIAIADPDVSSPFGSGIVNVYSGGSSTLLYSLSGPSDGGDFGSSFSGIGDADGDGLADLVVGASDSSPSGIQDAGAAWVYSGDPCGVIEPFGHGCGGTGAIRPDLTVTGCGSFAGTLTFNIEQGLGGAAGILFLGGQPAEISLLGGCTLNISPILGTGIPLALNGLGPGAGTIQFTAAIPPNGPAGSLSLQAFIADSGSPSGYSNTNGVTLTIVP